MQDAGRHLDIHTRDGRVMPTRDDISTLASQLHNMTINGQPASINARSMNFDNVGSPSALSTPFLLSIKSDDDTKVEVGFGRTSTPEADYIFHDAILIGNDQLFKIAVEEITITESAYVYYDITKSGITITADLMVSVTYPTSEDGTVKWVLGYAFWDTDKVTAVAQYQLGDIVIPARTT